MQRSNNQMLTCDEGLITNIDESATDNDFEFKALLGGLNNAPSNLKQIPILPPKIPIMSSKVANLRPKSLNTNRGLSVGSGNQDRQDAPNWGMTLSPMRKLDKN
jgi:hypothetical protein